MSYRFVLWRVLCTVFDYGSPKPKKKQIRRKHCTLFSISDRINNFTTGWHSCSAFVLTWKEHSEFLIRYTKRHLNSVPFDAEGSKWYLALYDRKFELIYSIFGDVCRHDNKAEYRDQYLLDNNGNLQPLPAHGAEHERVKTSIPEQWKFWKLVRICEGKAASHIPHYLEFMTFDFALVQSLP